MTDREFNATPEGQRAMFYGELTRSVVLTLNAAVRRMGGLPWEEQVIRTADEATLKSIREDLISEYNAKVSANLKP